MTEHEKTIAWLEWMVTLHEDAVKEMEDQTEAVAAWLDLRKNQLADWRRKLAKAREMEPPPQCEPYANGKGWWHVPGCGHVDWSR